MPEGDVLDAGLRVAAQHPRQAGDPLGADRVALVRHRRGALLARAERLLDLAHLGALQVADLGREALQAGAGDRDLRGQLGVAVARHDLRGDVLAAQAESLHHPRLDRGRDRGVGADRAGELADRELLEGGGEPRQVAVGLEGEAGEAQSEGGRLGVDAVGAADAERVALLQRPLDQRVAVSPGARRARPRRRPRSCSASAVSSTSEEVRP